MQESSRTIISQVLETPATPLALVLAERHTAAATIKATLNLENNHLYTARNQQRQLDLLNGIEQAAHILYGACVLQVMDETSLHQLLDDCLTHTMQVVESYTSFFSLPELQQPNAQAALPSDTPHSTPDTRADTEAVIDLLFDHTPFAAASYQLFQQAFDAQPDQQRSPLTSFTLLEQQRQVSHLIQLAACVLYGGYLTHAETTDSLNQRLDDCVALTVQDLNEYTPLST